MGDKGGRRRTATARVAPGLQGNPGAVGVARVVRRLALPPRRPAAPRPRGARQPELGSPHALPLSRESCAGPSRGGGGGAPGTAAMERLEHRARASQSAASHGHIKNALLIF